jgi:hypothetical protein
MAANGATAAPTVQAILLAMSDSTAYGPIGEHVPEELMPLVNQPFIGRVAGSLAALGIKEITVLAANRADLFSSFLEDGSRWGCKIKVVAVASEAQVYARLPELANCDFVLLGRASSLPVLNEPLLRECLGMGGAVLASADKTFLGWSLLPRSFLNSAMRECKCMADFDDLVRAARFRAFETQAPALHTHSPMELLKSTRAILDGLRPDQLIPGASAEKGVYISRNVVLHPTAQIHPPVAIDPDCNIDRGVHLGPYAVVGANSILGSHTTLENAVVFPGTYIGPHLELTNVCVDHNCLAYGDGAGAVPVPDPFLLSASEGQEFSHTARQIFRRVTGTLALLGFWPWILFFYLLALLMGVKKPFRRTEAVRLPADVDPLLWQTFNYLEFNTTESGAWRKLIWFCRVKRLPTLWNIACGNAAWVGLRPLAAAELRALPPDWRQIYRGGRVGIVRLAELDQAVTGECSDDQTYSSEAFYVVTSSFKSDCSILWRALRRK